MAVQPQYPCRQGQLPPCRQRQTRKGWEVFKHVDILGSGGGLWQPGQIRGTVVVVVVVVVLDMVADCCWC